jgi:hypothetical protein
MNAQPQATKETKDDLANNGEKFVDKLGKFINPFYVSFVIFWVVCNYDFLLILIGKKAILHELYTHFGYGCGVLNITDDGKIYTNYQLNLFVCVEKGRLAYAGYFAMWKVAIPFGLTWLHAHFVYPKIIKPVNNKHRSNIRDEKRQIDNDEAREMRYQEALDKEISIDAEQMFSKKIFNEHGIKF